MVHAANGLQSFAAFALMIWTTKMVAVLSEMQTECSLLQKAQAGMNDIVARLTLGDNQDVTNFFMNVKATNATKGVDLFDLYQCTYQQESGEKVVKSTAICVAGNRTNCVAFSEFETDDCLATSLCPYFVDDIPSFTADCSGINAEYVNCKLTCSSESSKVTGMESCIGTPSDGSGKGGTSSSGSILNTDNLWRVLCALCILLLGHFGSHPHIVI